MSTKIIAAALSERPPFPLGDFSARVELRWHRRFEEQEKCFGVLLQLEASMLGTIAIVEPRKAAPAPPAKEDLPPTKYLVNWDPSEWPGPKGDPDPPKAPERLPIAIRFGLGVRPEFAAGGSFGLTAEAGARYRLGSVAAEAHYGPSLSSVRFEAERVSFAVVSGSVVLCAHLGVFVPCGVGTLVGIIFPDHITPLPASAVYGALGVRANVEVPMPPCPHLFVRMGLNLDAAIHPPNYARMTRTVFDVSELSGGLAVAVVLEVPPPF
jgi:hypothetical protein